MPDSLTIVEDVSRSFFVTQNDVAPSGSLVNNSLTIVSGPAHGTIRVDSTGLVTYTPDLDYTGTDQFDYTVRDTNGATSNVATVTISIASVADAPVANDVSRVVDEGGSIVIDLTNEVTDLEGDIDWSSLQVTTSPQHGTTTVNPQTQTITYRPASDFFGTDSFRYQVADAAGHLSNVAVVTIVVAQVNDVPVAINDLYTIADAAPRDLAVLANDRDPDSDLSQAGLEIVANPTHGVVTIAGGQLRFTPASGYVGRDTLRYRVRDDAGAVSAAATVTIYVVPSANSWQNPENAFDANGDLVVSPLDALEVINRIGEELPPFPGMMVGAPPFVDIDGDGSSSPLDALLVINQLNGGATASNSGAAVGEPHADSELAVSSFIQSLAAFTSRESKDLRWRQELFQPWLVDEE